MSELWLEIYSYIMERDREAVKMQNVINTEIERLIIPYKNKLTEEELETLRYLLYDVSEISQKQSVLYGIKLVIKFIAVLL